MGNQISFYAFIDQTCSILSAKAVNRKVAKNWSLVHAIQQLFAFNIHSHHFQLIITQLYNGTIPR